MSELKNELKSRTISWIVMIAIFIIGMYSDTTVVLLFLFISFLATKEFCSMISIRKSDYSIISMLYIVGLIQYYFVHINWYNMFIIFIPVYSFIFISILLTLTQNTDDFLRNCGVIHLGAMIGIYTISHLAFLKNLNLSISSIYVLSGIVFLTEINDIYQYICGKSFGKIKVIKNISPNKTLAGLLGGIILTSLTSVFIWKYLLQLSIPVVNLLLIGALISIFGFLGDVFMSAIKRDLKIKDTSQLIPGHGGILDRIDSLIFVSPLAFHLVNYYFV